jgi:hypothetical protein
MESQGMKGKTKQRTKKQILHTEIKFVPWLFNESVSKQGSFTVHANSSKSTDYSDTRIMK